MTVTTTMTTTKTTTKTTKKTKKTQKIKKNYDGLDQGTAKMSSKHLDFINIATEVAKKSPMTQKHGCIVVYKNKIISSAYNFTPSAIQDRSVHAEVNALKKVKHKSFLFKDCSLYIVRIGPDSSMNALKYSKPCTNCTNYINLCNIKKVFYSTNYEYDSLNQDYDKQQLCQNQNHISNFSFVVNKHHQRHCLC